MIEFRDHFGRAIEDFAQRDQWPSCPVCGVKFEQAACSWPTWICKCDRVRSPFDSMTEPEWRVMCERFQWYNVDKGEAGDGARR